MVLSKFRIEIYLGVITLELLVKDIIDVIANMNLNVQFVVSNRNFSNNFSFSQMDFHK